MMLSDDNPQEQFMTPGARSPRARGSVGTSDPGNMLVNRPSTPNAAMSAARMGGGEQFNRHPNDLDKGGSPKIGQRASTITTARRSGRGSAKTSGGSNAERGASKPSRGGGGGTPTRAGGPGPQFAGVAPGRATPRPAARSGAGVSTYGSARNRGGSNGGGSGSVKLSTTRGQTAFGSAGVARGSKR